MPILAFLLLTCGAAPVAADTVVVCPEEFRDALAPWIEFRTGQGRAVAVVSSAGEPADIRERIRRHAEGGRLRFVLLAGDADPAARSSEAVRARSVPAHYTKAVVNVRYGSEEHIAGDNYYADLDEDGLPELAVGRLPADNADEMRMLVAKIAAYERSAPGDWQARVNVVAGVGGFGAVVDTVLETAARRFLTDGIPDEYDVRMTYGSWRSPYCPDPRQFHAATLGSLNERSLFWVYVGHGQPYGLDRVRTPAGTHHILDNRDVDKISAGPAGPIAIFLACYTGAFDAYEDCLAEQMIKQENGPIAALAGSRVTIPYSMSILGAELLQEAFERRTETIGEIVLHAKRRMAAPAKEGAESPERKLIDAVARLIAPHGDMLAEERIEHLALFNLLGDPLLRLKLPQPIEVGLSADQASSGEVVEVTGDCPLDGKLIVELDCQRDEAVTPLTSRDEFSQTDEFLSAFRAVYAGANQRTWTREERRHAGGPFRIGLTVPEHAGGTCHVKVSVVSDSGFAAGSADLYVRAR